MAPPPKRPARSDRSNPFIEAERRKRSYTISDEERERRRQRALQRVAEGRMGGSEYGKLGGRPRKPRVAETVAEEMRKESTAVVQALKDGLDPKKSTIPMRVKTATEVLSIEREERKLEMAEERDDLEQMDRAALLSLIARKISGNPVVGAALEAVNGDSINSTAEEITP